MALRLVTLAALAATAVAKTDIAGCTYIDAVYTPPGRPDIQPYATRTWYVPDTGEICELLDCGGGRAPPKTDVPGCSNYKGTETYSPRYMPTTTSAAEKEKASDDAEESDDSDNTDAEETGSDSDASETESVTTPASSRSGAAPEESGSGDDGEDGGNEGGDDDNSGAAAVGASLAGVVAVAAALGLF